MQVCTILERNVIQGVLKNSETFADSKFENDIRIEANINVEHINMSTSN